MQVLREVRNCVAAVKTNMCLRLQITHRAIFDRGANRHQLTTVAEQSGAVARITESMVVWDKHRDTLRASQFGSSGH